MKKFGPGKLWVEKVWAQNIFINFITEMDHPKKIIFANFSDNFFVGVVMEEGRKDRHPRISLLDVYIVYVCTSEENQ